MEFQLDVIEWKHWVEKGFKEEGFNIVGEVVLGHLNRDLLEECPVKERLQLGL
jgi:hypothetical protein